MKKIIILISIITVCVLNIYGSDKIQFINDKVNENQSVNLDEEIIRGYLIKNGDLGELAFSLRQLIKNINIITDMDNLTIYVNAKISDHKLVKEYFESNDVLKAEVDKYKIFYEYVKSENRKLLYSQKDICKVYVIENIDKKVIAKKIRDQFKGVFASSRTQENSIYVIAKIDKHYLVKEFIRLNDKKSVDKVAIKKFIENNISKGVKEKNLKNIYKEFETKKRFLVEMEIIEKYENKLLSNPKFILTEDSKYECRWDFDRGTIEPVLNLLIKKNGSSNEYKMFLNYGIRTLKDKYINGEVVNYFGKTESIDLKKSKNTEYLKELSYKKFKKPYKYRTLYKNMRLDFDVKYKITQLD